MSLEEQKGRRVIIATIILDHGIEYVHISIAHAKCCLFSKSWTRAWKGLWKRYCERWY